MGKPQNHNGVWELHFVFSITLVHGSTWPVKLIMLAHDTSHLGPIRKQQDFL